MGIDITQYFSYGVNEWAVEQLWEAAEDLPIESVCINDIVLSIMNCDMEENIERVKNADLNYPIILTPESYVADGMHRIVKTILMGKEYVLAKRIKVMPKPIHTIISCEKVY